jgi:hypothetical protein
MKACGGAWYEKNCHEGSACSQTAQPTSAPTAAAVDVSKIDGFGGDDNSLILTLRTKGLLHVDSNPYLLQHSNMAPLLVGDGENNVSAIFRLCATSTAEPNRQEHGSSFMALQGVWIEGEAAGDVGAFLMDRMVGWGRTAVSVPRCFSYNMVERQSLSLAKKALEWNPNGTVVNGTSLICGSLTVFIQQLTGECKRVKGSALCKGCQTDDRVLESLAELAGFDIAIGNDDRRLLPDAVEFDTGDCNSCVVYGQPCGSAAEHQTRKARTLSNLFCVGTDGPIVFVDNGLHFASIETSADSVSADSVWPESASADVDSQHRLGQRRAVSSMKLANGARPSCSDWPRLSIVDCNTQFTAGLCKYFPARLHHAIELIVDRGFDQFKRKYVERLLAIHLADLLYNSSMISAVHTEMLQQLFINLKALNVLVTSCEGGVREWHSKLFDR